MNKIILFFILILTGFSLFGISDGTVKINMLIFVTENCEICDDLQTSILPDLESKYHLEYTIYYDFNENTKALLKEIEQEFGKLEEYPVILMGSQLITGDEIYSKFESLIEEFAGMGGCCVPLLFNFQEKQVSSAIFPVHMAYIFDKTDAELNQTDNDLEKLKGIYPSLNIREFNLDTLEGEQMNQALCKYYNLTEKDYLKTPKMFIGNETLLDMQFNIDTLKMLIRKYQENEDLAPWEKKLDKNQGE